MPVQLICGCGYLGRRLAQRWLAAGHEVWATTRSPERAAEFAAAGIRPIVVDIRRPVSLPAALPTPDTVTFAVGFDRTAGQTIEQVYVGGLKNFLAALPPAVGRFIYLSSTGVFDQTDGEWVDEDSPCNPRRPGGRACLAAEHVLAEVPLAPRRIILRLAGIYGPQRIPKLAAVQAGEPIETYADGYLNLIHVEDAVSAVVCAEEQVTPPALLVISDGQPVLRGDFYRELARLLSAPAPRIVEPADPGTAGRSASDKRLRNDRMRRELQFPLQFPSYREGLASIVADARGIK